MSEQRDSPFQRFMALVGSQGRELCSRNWDTYCRVHCSWITKGFITIRHLKTECTGQKWLSWSVIIHVPVRCGLMLMFMFLFSREQDSKVYRPAYRSHFLKPKRNHDRRVCILNSEICFLPTAVFVLSRVQNGEICFLLPAEFLSFFLSFWSSFSSHSQKLLKGEQPQLKTNVAFRVGFVIKEEFNVFLNQV